MLTRSCFLFLLFNVGGGDNVCRVDGGRVDNGSHHAGRGVVDDGGGDGSVAGLAALTSCRLYVYAFLELVNKPARLFTLVASL
jgi:hypothetical protein